jgi:hypothetical protein
MEDAVQLRKYAPCDEEAGSYKEGRLTGSIGGGGGGVDEGMGMDGGERARYSF